MGNIEKFNEIAGVYDTEARDAVAKIIADEIRRCEPNAKMKTAVDYGCGTGLVGMRLLQDFKKVLFIDAARNMVEQAKAKAAAVKARNAEFLCLDLTKELLADLHADCVIMAQTLLHIKEVELILKNIFSVLNSGGSLLIADFDKNDQVASDLVHNGFVQSDLAKTAEQIGFCGVESHTFFRGHNLFMNKDASLFIMRAVKK